MTSQERDDIDLEIAKRLAEAEAKAYERCAKSLERGLAKTSESAWELTKKFRRWAEEARKGS